MWQWLGDDSSSSGTAKAGRDSSAAAASLGHHNGMDGGRYGKLTTAADKAGDYLEDIIEVEIILLTPFPVTYVRCKLALPGQGHVAQISTTFPYKRSLSGTPK